MHGRISSSPLTDHLRLKCARIESWLIRYWKIITKEERNFEIWPLLMRPLHMNIILAWVNLMFRPGQYSISITRPRGLRDAKVRELSYSTYLHGHENRNRSTSSMSLKIPLKCDAQTSWRDMWQCMPGNYWRSLGISSQHARERRAMHRLVVKFQRHRRSYWTIANSNVTKS